MSSRRPADQQAQSIDAARLRSELEALKQQNAAVEAAGTYAEQGLPSRAGLAPDGVVGFDQLTQVEQAAGSLGVHPEAWKPIKCARCFSHPYTRATGGAYRHSPLHRFMNNAHYDSLIKNNALDEDLTRRIEAFRQVAAQ